MERITAPAVRGMFDRAVQAGRMIGLNGPWELQEGSQTNGQPWRMFMVTLPGHGHSDTVLGDSYLGWTTREAYGALHAMARAWEAAWNQKVLLDQ